jgi:hypothetical protein
MTSNNIYYTSVHICIHMQICPAAGFLENLICDKWALQIEVNYKGSMPSLW